MLDVHYHVVMATERGRLSSPIAVASCKTSQMSAFLFFINPIKCMRRNLLTCLNY